MPLSEQERAHLTDAIAEHCEAIRRMFTPGAKVTVLVRCPQTPGDGDVLVTCDSDDEIRAAMNRRLAAMPKPMHYAADGTPLHPVDRCGELCSLDAEKTEATVSPTKER